LPLETLPGSPDIIGAGSGGGVGAGAGIMLAGIIDLTLVVAIAARDITSERALATRLTTLRRAEAALLLTRRAALRAFVFIFRIEDFARRATRRTLRRARDPARRAAERALDFILLRDLRFLAMNSIPPWCSNGKNLHRAAV
jgi:hypothetical protein